ncbi:hypothetical protein BC7_00015 [Bacillus phage BC-7]|nr:hypothetical protein BC7_00015 [Bacillus phage BC-7]
MATARQIDLIFDLSYPSDHPKFLQRIGENKSTEILVQVFNARVPYNISGSVLGFEMRNDNNKIVIDTEQSRFTKVEPLKGVFSYTPPVEVQSFYGNSYLAYFTFKNGSDRVTTERFRFYNDEDVQVCIAPELQEHYVSVIDGLVESNKEAMVKAEEIKNLVNANQVVKKAGDTMTGTLNGTTFTANGEIIFTNAGTGRRTRLFMDNSNGTAWTAVTEKTAGKGDWDYSEHLRVGDRRNWLKSSDLYMDYFQPNGNTKVLTASTDLDTVQAPGAYAGSALLNAPEGLTSFLYIEVLRYSDAKYCKQTITTLTGGSTPRIFTRRKVNDVWESWVETIQSTGGTISGNINLNFPEATKARSIRWQKDGVDYISLGTNNVGDLVCYDQANAKSIFAYYPSTNTFDINTHNSNLLRKTGDTATGHMNFRGNINQETADAQKGVSMVVNSNVNKWSIGPKMEGNADWSKEISLDLYSGKVTVASLATKKDTDVPITLVNGATNPDTSNPPRCYRRGNTIMITGSYRRGSSTGTMASLPAELRPLVDCTKNILASDGTPVQLYVGASTGNISINVPDKTVVINETFLVNS